MPLYPQVKQPVVGVMKARRLTLPAVAIGVGFDMTTEDAQRKSLVRLRHVLHGYAYPDVDLMERMSRYFDVGVDELFDVSKREHAYRREAKRRERSLAS